MKLYLNEHSEYWKDSIVQKEVNWVLRRRWKMSIIIMLVLIENDHYSIQKPH